MEEIGNIRDISLRNEDRDALRKLGALGWPENEVCAYFGFDPAAFHAVWADPDSEISRLYRQGGLHERARMEISVLDSALAGDAAAVDKFREITRDRSFSLSKLDLYGGSSDPGAFIRVRDYIVSGNREGLTDSEAMYLDLLSLVHSIDQRAGKRKTIAVLTSEPFGFSYDRASNVYAEMLELFYADRNVSRAALRAKMADQYDTLYHLAVESASTAKDYKVAADILAQKMRVLRLDCDDPKVLPEQEYARQYRLLTLSPEAVGLPPVNRDELAAQIDGLVDVPEVEKERLREEAGIKDLDIIKILENGIQEESE